MYGLAILVLACGAVAAFWPPASLAAETPAKKAQVAVAAVTQENQKLIQATVTAGGKPIQGAGVAFFVQRTFGDLQIGKDESYDDGTAFTPYPTGLAWGPEGEYRIIARITKPPEYAGAEGRMTVQGLVDYPRVLEPFPRALWAPSPPWALVAVIVGIMIGVWATYGYVGLLLLRIRKGKRT